MVPDSNHRNSGALRRWRDHPNTHVISALVSTTDQTDQRSAGATNRLRIRLGRTHAAICQLSIKSTLRPTKTLVLGPDSTQDPCCPVWFLHQLTQRNPERRRLG